VNALLWIGQVLFGVYFIAVGIMHFVVPEGLPAQLAWMYDLSEPAHIAAGTAEILGGLGLILPGLTRIWPWLTPLAAAGLIVVMVGAAVWHAGRGEVQNLGVNLANVVVLALIAYGRWRVRPLEPRAPAPSGAGTA
jgi:uncharacterized membrane protein